MKTNNQELLEEAKRRYPIGTIFKSAYSGCTFELTGGKYRVQDNGNIRCHADNNDYQPFLRYARAWAEISFTPKPIINNTYSLY